MKLHFSATKIVFILALTVIIIGFYAFSQKEKTNRYSFRKETNPTNIDTPTPLIHDRYLTERDMDKIEDAIKKLDEQMEKLNGQMKKMDFSKVQKEVDNAMQKVDFDKIEKRMNESLRKIDVEKMEKDIKESVSRVGNLDGVKAQMQIAKAQLEMQRANIDLNRREAKVNVEKAMRNARESMMKAREELRNLKEFTDQLKNDGLINKNKNYKIEVRSGELYINDKKQSKEVNDKYRKYYKKDNFTINLNEGDGIRI